MYIEEAAVKLNGTGLLETAQISSTKKEDLPGNLSVNYWTWPFSSVIYLLTMVIFPSKALVYQAGYAAKQRDLSMEQATELIHRLQLRLAKQNKLNMDSFQDHPIVQWGH